MTTATSSPPLTLVNYQTRLPSFEGPLDLLLRLIERQRLDITDVSLVAVTDQFLSFVGQMEGASLDVIAEFTAIGTRLALLKSRSLLPRPPVPEEDVDSDPDDLVQQLRAYKRLKSIAAQLGKRRDDDLVSFDHRGSGPLARPTEVAPPRLARYEPNALSRAIRRRLSTIPNGTRTIRQRRIVSVREISDRLLELINRLSVVRFSEVIMGYETRSERATAFLATLVLIRRRAVDAAQEGLFGEIRLSAAARNGTEPDNGLDADDEFLNEEFSHT